MSDILFYKTEYAYYTNIELGESKPRKEILLDTGSPITVISIPALLQITGEPLTVFRHNVDRFLSTRKALKIGGYDMQTNDMRFSFIPYMVNEICIGNVVLKPFIFWVNVSNYKSREIRESSILFGLDYINQGKKWFDDNDDFHIEFNKGMKCNTWEVGAAIKQSSGILELGVPNICEITVYTKRS